MTAMLYAAIVTFVFSGFDDTIRLTSRLATDEDRCLAIHVRRVGVIGAVICALVVQDRIFTLEWSKLVAMPIVAAVCTLLMHLNWRRRRREQHPW